MYKLYNSLLTFAVSKGNNFIKFKNSSFVACICEDMCHICFYEKKNHIFATVIQRDNYYSY